MVTVEPELPPSDSSKLSVRSSVSEKPYFVNKIIIAINSTVCYKKHYFKAVENKKELQSF